MLHVQNTTHHRGSIVHKTLLLLLLTLTIWFTLTFTAVRGKCFQMYNNDVSKKESSFLLYCRGGRSCLFCTDRPMLCRPPSTNKPTAQVATNQKRERVANPPPSILRWGRISKSRAEMPCKAQHGVDEGCRSSNNLARKPTFAHNKKILQFLRWHFDDNDDETKTRTGSTWWVGQSIIEKMFQKYRWVIYH